MKVVDPPTTFFALCILSTLEYLGTLGIFALGLDPTRQNAFAACPPGCDPV